MTFTLFQRGQGAPAREPLVSEEQQKQMMMHYYRRQEELKVSLFYYVICFLLLVYCALKWFKFGLNVIVKNQKRKKTTQHLLKVSSFFSMTENCICKLDFFFLSIQKLDEADDDSYLQSEWSDRQALKRQFQGLTNIKWGPR